MKKILVIKDLYSYVGDSEIVKGINLELEEGKIYVIMGPNGSGKSTLANSIMGNKKYDTKGKIFFNGEEIIDMKVDGDILCAQLKSDFDEVHFEGNFETGEVECKKI
jgi:Fe-S cluster assembly ATP-binding protein